MVTPAWLAIPPARGRLPAACRWSSPARGWL